jgi:hypothetical protein
MLKEMAFVTSIEPSPEADVTAFAREGGPMLFEDFANMIIEQKNK